MYHVIAFHPVYWRVGLIYRKHSFLYCCVMDSVYGPVAWQRVDQIRYDIFRLNYSDRVTALLHGLNNYKKV
jgi:hypothetical protein